MPRFLVPGGSESLSCVPPGIYYGLSAGGLMIGLRLPRIPVRSFAWSLSLPPLIQVNRVITAFGLLSMM